MAAVQQRKLVHKQFNSPIGLYSDNNVKATLDRDLKMMSNGTMGVDYDPAEKPANLANSAVLKMLQEEENAKRNGPRSGGLKRVAWPPEEYHSPSRVVPQPQHNENQSGLVPAEQYQPNAPQYHSPTPQPQSQAPINAQYAQQQQFRDSRSREPTAQRQPSQPRQASQGRSFPSADPSFLRGSTPSYLAQQPAANEQVHASSPYTTSFSGGRAVNPAGGHQYPAAPTNVFPDEIATYHVQPQQQQQPQPQQQPQQQSYGQRANAPATLNLSQSVEQPLGWSPVKAATPVQTGYILSPPVQQKQQQPQYQAPPQQQQPQYHQQQYQAPQQQQQQPQYQQQPQQYQQQQYQQQQPQQYNNQYAENQYNQQAEPVYQNNPQQFYPSTVDQQYHFRQPSPGMVTLRKEAPIMQESSPVFTSEPAAAKFGGGTNMRGDQKWPPQEYKQSELENVERLKLAHGPVFRPRRVQKDYTDFFNQHALNSTYPSYRAPPGTQHSAEH